jgi:hypothetical protein
VKPRRYSLHEAEIRARYGVPLNYLAARTVIFGRSSLNEIQLKWQIDYLRERQSRLDKMRWGSIPRLTRPVWSIAENYLKAIAEELAP